MVAFPLAFARYLQFFRFGVPTALVLIVTVPVVAQSVDSSASTVATADGPESETPPEEPCRGPRSATRGQEGGRPQGKGAGDHDCLGCQHDGGTGGEGRAGRPEMEAIHFLLDHHDEIQRSVEQLPDGVRTTTTTTNPELTEMLRRHVTEMETLLASGGRIRNWDPLFVELFEHAGAIWMEFANIDNGIVVTETSTDESVVRLIHAHARKVDDFVARGRDASHEETPLPEGYPGAPR